MGNYQRGRRSLADLRRAHDASLKFYAESASKEVPPHLLNALPPKRDRVRKPAGDRLTGDIEAPVIAAVADLIEQHPNVLFAVRQNSGSIPYERDGRPVPVWFYKKIKTPEELTLTDYWGFLKDRRPFAIECKKPSWKSPTTPREFRQRAFLQMIIALGGVGCFVRSAEEAAEALR